MPNLINLTGKKFNRWTVLKKVESKGGSVYWLCQCECGTIKEVRGQHLKSGASKSCGCLQREKAKETMKNIGSLPKDPKKYSHKSTNFIDLTGQKFYHWTVLSRTKNNIDGTAMWLCQCDCGTKKIIKGTALRSGESKSCGCEKSSYGEQKIEQILQENKIKYEKEKTFSTCTFPDTQRLARFDFYLPDYNILIEYDGIQHFIMGNGIYNNPEKFKITQQHDQFKNQWCKNNNITLIRIPYTKYDTLTINDLIFLKN